MSTVEEIGSLKNLSDLVTKPLGLWGATSQQCWVTTDVAQGGIKDKLGFGDPSLIILW